MPIFHARVNLERGRFPVCAKQDISVTEEHFHGYTPILCFCSENVSLWNVLSGLRCEREKEVTINEE